MFVFQFYAPMMAVDGTAEKSGFAENTTAKQSGKEF